MPWFERAVAAKEKGDVHGRGSHGEAAAMAPAGGEACVSSWFSRPLEELARYATADVEELR